MSDDGVWIKSEPSLDGSTYMVTVEASDDLARVLTPDDALQYAWGVLAAAQRADYDAAIIKQLRKLDLPLDAVGQMIADLRNDRPALDPAHTQPLRLQSGVNQKYEPFLLLYIGGAEEPAGQWTVHDARQHALTVLEVVSAAELDSAYYRALVGQVGIDGPRARNVVEDISNFREPL